MKESRIITFILLCISACGLYGCGEKDGPEDPSGGAGPVTGHWHLESWGVLTPQQADVYVSFGEDGTFDLYQRVYSPYYVHYDGTYVQDGDQVSGTYSDGTPWNATYSASLSADLSVLTLTSATDASDVSVYGSVESIPGDIISGTADLKSGTSGDDGFRFL